MEKGWECNSVAVTPDRNILFSYSKGAKLITRDHEEVWNISAPEGCEMQTARVLSNGIIYWRGVEPGYDHGSERKRRDPVENRFRYPN